MKYKYILFDLDGTIAESALGIRHSLERMLADLDVGGVDLSDYTKYIGPPLYDTLRGLCGLPEEKVEKGYDLYRHYYDTEGRAMNKPYDGIREVLSAMRDSGARLAVCSSKLETTAKVVMDDIGMTGYFDKICGSNREGTRKDKRDLIPYAIEQLGGSIEEKSSAVMLGDTWYDAKGAFECGVDFIACSYGYGAEDDMQKYNPVAWAENPSDILNILKTEN